MIPNEKYIEIARGLLEKTRSRKAAWQLSGRTPYSIPPETSGIGSVYLDPSVAAPPFSLQLPQTMIILEFESPTATPDTISLHFYNKEKQKTAEWTVEEGDEHWPLMESLYREVREQVLKSDKTIEDVEAYLASK